MAARHLQAVPTLKELAPVIPLPRHGVTTLTGLGRQALQLVAEGRITRFAGPGGMRLKADDMPAGWLVGEIKTLARAQLVEWFALDQNTSLACLTELGKCVLAGQASTTGPEGGDAA